MIMLVRIIGILITCMGLMVVLNPGAMKKMLAFWKQGKRIYLGGLLRVLFGVIFLWSASLARLPVVMGTLGIFLIVAGLFIFILRTEKIKSMLDWWDKKPPSALRIIGILVFAIGALIIYSM